MPAMIARATIIPRLEAIFLIFPSFWISSGGPSNIPDRIQIESLLTTA